MSQFVSIISHRGGVGKSLIAAALAAESAAGGTKTLLLDLGPAGGAASLGSGGFLPGRPSWDTQREPALIRVAPGLHSLRATTACLTDAGWRQLESVIAANGFGLVVIDSPTLSRGAQSRVLARSDIALIAVTPDAASLKSLTPFFEYLAEEKNRPNRVFQPMAVLTRVQRNSPQRELLHDAAATFLAPLLLPVSIPEDASFAAAMGEGLIPHDQPLSDEARRAVRELSALVLERLKSGDRTVANA